MKYYYITESNQAAGPVDQTLLLDLFRQGLIHGETGIAADGSSEWIPFRQMQFEQQPPAFTSVQQTPPEVRNRGKSGFLFLAIFLILIGILDFGLVLLSDFNITSWMGGFSRYSGWISIAVGAHLLKLRHDSGMKCPDSKSGESRLLEVTASEISAAVTASELIIDTRGEEAMKFIPSPPPIGVSSINLNQISGFNVHKEKGITQGLVITLTDQRKIGLRVGSLAPQLEEYLKKIKTGVPFEFTRLDANKRYKKSIGYGAAGWAVVVVLGLIVSFLGESPLQLKKHTKITNWSDVPFLDVEKYRECVRGSINQGTPFKVYGKVNSSAGEENVYQCDLVVEGYEVQIDSNDFFAACPRTLADDDYFIASVQFDQNVSFETLLKQERTIPKFDVVDLQIKTENEVLKLVAKNSGGEHFEAELKSESATKDEEVSETEETDRKVQQDGQLDSVVQGKEKAVKQEGRAASLMRLEYEIAAINERRSLGEDSELKASKGGVYVVVDWSYKNSTKKPMGAFSKPDLTLLSPDMTEYEEDVDATLTRATEVELDEKIVSNLNPGITVQSASVFEVAEKLLAEDGWRIQIEFENHKTHYPLKLSKKKETTDAVPQAQMESEQAVKKASEEKEAKGKLPELKGELATVNAKIESERARYQSNLDIINRLTNFKRTPVQEGTRAYYQCLEASKQIKEVEDGASGLKAEKAKLEAVIKELEK